MPLVTGGIALGSVLLEGKGQSSANRQAEEEAARQQASVDKWMADFGAYQDELRGALGGPGSQLFAPRETTQEQQMRQVVNQLVSPEVSKEGTPLVSMLRKQYEGDVARGAALPPGFAEKQARDIVASFASQEAGEREALARLGGSTIGSPTARARAGAIADLGPELAMLEEQLMSKKRGEAAAFSGKFDLGQRTRGTTTTSGLTTTTGPADLGAILAYYGMLAPPQAPIVEQPGTPSAVSGGLQQGIGTFASLYPLLTGGGGGGGITGGVPEGVVPQNFGPGSVGYP